MRILIVEDEPGLAKPLEKAFAGAGYACDHAPDGEHAGFLVDTETYDAIVLDLGLPKIDGLTLLKRWRDAGNRTPILILTARGTWHEKVQGIDSGADDYVAKPFQTEEVLARIRALIRRSAGIAQPELHCGALTLDARTARVAVDGVAVKLTSHEYRVLSYLMHHQDQVVTRTDLIDHIYAQDFDRDSNTVEVFIARLRRKLGGSFIETVRGAGYRLNRNAR